MGSSKYLKADIKLLGKHNFKKEILHKCNSFDELVQKEKEIVNKDFVFRTDTYNRIIGGNTTKSDFTGMIPCKDKNGNIVGKIYRDDPRYLSGEFVQNTKYTITGRDKNGNTLQISIFDPRYLSKEIIHNSVGKPIVRDKYGNCFRINKDDPRYLSGELISSNKGLNYNKGKNNPQYGTIWIKNDFLKQNMKVKKEKFNEQYDEFKDTGWVKGSCREYVSILKKYKN